MRRLSRSARCGALIGTAIANATATKLAPTANIRTVFSRFQSASDAAEAFELLYGLVIQDTQIRVLLGESVPPPNAIHAQAKTAVARFLTLTRQ